MVSLTDFDLMLPQTRDALDVVKRTLNRHFEIVDWQGIDIILAVAASHFIPGEIIWLRFIGPSRSGKTEILRALTNHPAVEEMEVLTPAAFRGGLKKGPKILQRIAGKLVITKDIAAILTSRKDVRTEIFGILRSVKDGKLTSDFGSEEGHLVQFSSFDWILASTSSGIEQQRTLEGLLGQRFIDLRWKPGDRKKMAYQAACNNPYMNKIRNDLSLDVISLLLAIEDEMINFPEDLLTGDDFSWMAHMADMTTLLRTPVQHDKSGHIIVMPEPEVGTEVAQAFSKIVKGLLCLGLPDWKPYIRRIARDCIPSMRTTLLYSLQRGPKTVLELQKDTNIPQSTIYYNLNSLKLLDIVSECDDLIYLLLDDLP